MDVEKAYILGLLHDIGRKFGARHLGHKLDFMMPPMFNTNSFIKIYDFDPRLMKASGSITSKRRLEEDGSNIANVLQLILRSKSKKKKLLNLLCDSLPFIEQIDVQNNVDKSVSYRIKEKYNNKTFYSDFLSDGTVNMLALIIALYFDGESGIIIIEEPERNLHPQLMSKIVEMAKEVSKEKQIIITTHNPELVKYSDINDILFAKRTVEGFTKISKPSKNGTQGDTQDDTQGDTQEKIIKMIEENPRVSTSDMAKRLGIGSATVKRKIKKMPNISYVGSGYSGHWEIK